MLFCLQCKSSQMYLQVSLIDCCIQNAAPGDFFSPTQAHNKCARWQPADILALRSSATCCRHIRKASLIFDVRQRRTGQWEYQEFS